MSPFTITCQRARDLLRESAAGRAFKAGDKDGFMVEIDALLSEPTTPTWDRDPSEAHDCDECRLVRMALAAGDGHGD